MDEAVKKPVKFTSVVRRGLVLMRGLADDSLDDNKPPGSTIVAKWTNPQLFAYRQAGKWIDQETQKEEKPVKDEVSCEAPPPTAD